MPSVGILLKFFESICVRINHNELRLSVDEPSRKLSNFRTISWHAKIWQKLICWIAQPHRLDISCYYVCWFIFRGQIEMLHCCCHSVWKRFCKYCKKFTIHLPLERFGVIVQALECLLKSRLTRKNKKQSYESDKLFNKSHYF